MVQSSIIQEGLAYMHWKVLDESRHEFTVYIGTTLQLRFQINQTLPHALKTYLLPETITLIEQFHNYVL